MKPTNGLQHDNAQLYFLIGAITGALAELPPEAQWQMICLIERKYSAADDEFRDTLATFIEALECSLEKKWVG